MFAVKRGICFYIRRNFPDVRFFFSLLPRATIRYTYILILKLVHHIFAKINEITMLCMGEV